MKKPFLAATLAAVVLAIVLTAGCVNPLASSPSPTPSETATCTPTPTATATATPRATGQQTINQYLTTIVQQQNFVVVNSFVQQPSPQAGVAVYNSTVRNQNGTYNVSVQACSNIQIAQTQFISQQAAFISQGYVQVQSNATFWYGFNKQLQQGASVEYGTSPLIPYYCMVVTGGSTGQTTFEQIMFQQVLVQLHARVSSGDGLGQNLGQGTDSNTRVKIRQQVNVNINNRG